MVRIAPEITIKSNSVRAKFVRALERNLRAALKARGITATIETTWSRLYVTSDDGTVGEILSQVFGISSYSVIEHTSASDLETMAAMAKEHYSEAARNKSFCVRIRRRGKVGYTSVEAERKVGSALMPVARKVKLVDPEFKLSIEANPDGALYYSTKHPGPGGLPLGVEGKVLVLMSGGFDSPVAAWRMMKRGLACDFVFWNMAGKEYLDGTVAVTKALVDGWSHGHKPRFFVGDFHPIMAAITKGASRGFGQILLKRQMLKAAVAIGDEGLIKYDALVKGDAIGQVSSQTLSNLVAIDDACPRLVLRPLIGFDKTEIIEASRKIGTYYLSEKIKEHCAITPKNPKTRCTIAMARSEDARLDDSLIEGVVQSMASIDLAAWQPEASVALSKIPDNAVVVDLRPKSYFNHWHYNGARQLLPETVHDALKAHDKALPLVLYCSFGVESSFIAEQLRAKGYDAWSFAGGSSALHRYAHEGRDQGDSQAELESYFFRS